MPTDRHRQPDTRSLDLIGFSVFPVQWSRVKEVMAEFHPSEQLLRDALRAGHGLEIDDTDGDPLLYFVVDEVTAGKLALYKIHDPTLCQLIGTSSVISDTEADAIARFKSLMHGEN